MTAPTSPRKEFKFIDNGDDPIEAMNNGARFCYYVDGNSMRDENGIIPSSVVEGVPWHRPMLGNGPCASPWYWGQTLEEAQETCKRANEKLGLTQDDVDAIVLSSIVATNRRKKGRIGE